MSPKQVEKILKKFGLACEAANYDKAVERANKILELTPEETEAFAQYLKSKIVIH